MKNDYPVSQQVLYTVFRILTFNLNLNLSRFTSFSAIYTAAFVASLRTALTNAIALPDEQGRYANAEVYEVRLIDAAIAARDKFQNLKRYIEKTYPKREQKARLEEAGIKYYTASVNNNWNEVQGLTAAAALFLQYHTAELEANNNMPHAFIDEFTTAKDGFDAIFILHSTELELAKTATTVKINTNNLLYARIMDVCKDGQEIFKYEEEVISLFIFSSVVDLVTGTGFAGMYGIVTIEGTETGVPATLTLMGVDHNYRCVADVNGNYDMGNIAGGVYKLIITMNGFQTKTIEGVKIESGVSTNKDFSLQQA